MERTTFIAVTPLRSVALGVALVIGSGSFAAGLAQSKSRFPCPSGQVYRVSKKICVPKATAPKLASDRGESAASSAPAQPERRDEGAVIARPQHDVAPPAPRPTGVAADALRGRPGPEAVAARPEPKGVFDAIHQLRVTRQSSTAELEDLALRCGSARSGTGSSDRPFEWAAIRNNLANALVVLGERQGGAARLDEAVALYREALTGGIRENAPREWATIKTNLAEVLTILGERESAVLKLAEAAAVKRETIDWARRTGEAGVALMRLAEKLSDKTIARTALAQIDMALGAIHENGDSSVLEAYYEEQLPKARALVESLGEN